MFAKYQDWKVKRSINKVKNGDGHPLKPYHFWQFFHRSLFFMKKINDDGKYDVYAVDIHYFSEKETAELYKNGKHFQTAKLPATFPIGDGVIEVAITMYGLKRMHYVGNDREKVLAPHRLSLEGLRLRLDKAFPLASKLIGGLAIAVLLMSIVLGFPQLLALITQLPFVEERFGVFESPIVLANWLNSTLLITGILAALERAITLKSHWLIDLDTSWWDN